MTVFVLACIAAIEALLLAFIVGGMWGDEHHHGSNCRECTDAGRRA